MTRNNGKKNGFAAIDGMVSDLEIANRSARSVYIGKSIAAWRYALSGKNWLPLCLFIALLFVYIGRSAPPPETNQASNPPPAAPAAPTVNVPTQTAVIAPAPTPLPPLDPVAARSTPPETKVSKKLLVERIPPIGQGLVLDPAQIRYCLSEGIRITAWHERANRYSQRAVDMFNAVASDYNARCGNFSYRSGTLESVRAEVEKNREMLVQLGFESAERNR